MHSAQKLVNHVVLVLDASSSMKGHEKKLIEVADQLIRDLALKSEELNQETRISIYTFADLVGCQIFDMDVMRTPSIKDLYTAYGNTALRDAVIRSIQDLRTTSQIYGDHAFLTYVLTDGMENVSRHSTRDFMDAVSNASENWTTAFLVPNSAGVTYLTRSGVPRGNIAVWDTTGVNAITDVVKTISNTTNTFMTNRASGIRGTSNLFSTGIDAVNDATVKRALLPLPTNSYRLLPVPSKIRIDEFVENNGYRYRLGSGYYELSKTEHIQPQKEIIVVDKYTGQAYGGSQARSLVGLGSDTVKVKPDYNPKYKIFVQSTAPNRNLMPNTELLYLSGN